jgi:hypothetical protein
MPKKSFTEEQIAHVLCHILPVCDSTYLNLNKAGMTQSRIR